MMILIIHAHPDPDSFTAALSAAVSSVLESAGKQVTVVDLYRIPGPFPPILEAEEFHRKTSLDTVVQQQMKLLDEAEGLEKDIILLWYPFNIWERIVSATKVAFLLLASIISAIFSSCSRCTM